MPHKGSQYPGTPKLPRHSYIRLWPAADLCPFRALWADRAEGGSEGQIVKRAPSESKEWNSLELWLLVFSCSLFSFQRSWLNVFKQAVWRSWFLTKGGLERKKCNCNVTVGLGIKRGGTTADFNLMWGALWFFYVNADGQAMWEGGQGWLEQVSVRAQKRMGGWTTIVSIFLFFRKLPRKKEENEKIEK